MPSRYLDWVEKRRPVVASTRAHARLFLLGAMSRCFINDQARWMPEQSGTRAGHGFPLDHGVDPMNVGGQS